MKHMMHNVHFNIQILYVPKLKYHTRARLHPRVIF